MARVEVSSGDTAQRIVSVAQSYISRETVSTLPLDQDRICFFLNVDLIFAHNVAGLRMLTGLLKFQVHSVDESFTSALTLAQKMLPTVRIGLRKQK
jgi:hypothetical protein